MNQTSQAFQWKGIDTTGKRTNGTVMAADVKAALAELKKMGVEVISLEQKNASNLSSFRIFSRQKKIKPADILHFTRYVSMMLAAGLPIIQALDIVAQDQDNPTLRDMVQNIKKEVAGGKTLGESFSQYPKHFNDLYCSLISTGEKSGTLDKILLRLGNHLERTENLKRKIKKAMIYPIVILSVALIVSLILLIFVVPQFQTMFKSFGAQLPMFTLMVVHLSDFVRHDWWIMLGVVVGTVLIFRRYLRENPRFKKVFDRFILKIYVVGPVMRKGSIARFARTLATTLEAGMPITDAMKGMPQIVTNSLYSQAVMDMREEVTSGIQLSVAMKNVQLFPNMAVQMVAVGEASGTLSEMLNKVADHYETEVNDTVDNLSSLLEPVIMVILGIIVGGFVIAMYLPIFKLGSLF